VERRPVVPPSASSSHAAVENVRDLGRSIVIKGELSGSEDLTVCGQIEGSITLPDHALTIGSDADIKAEISAKTVVVMGAVTGNVTAGDRLAIQATGVVTSDIATPRLVIADGGRLHGKVHMPQPECSVILNERPLVNGIFG
jgi:cytoskeletal protein CcmA (bactofilin family)